MQQPQSYTIASKSFNRTSCLVCKAYCTLSLLYLTKNNDRRVLNGCLFEYILHQKNKCVQLGKQLQFNCCFTHVRNTQWQFNENQHTKTIIIVEKLEHALNHTPHQWTLRFASTTHSVPRHTKQHSVDQLTADGIVHLSVNKLQLRIVCSLLTRSYFWVNSRKGNKLSLYAAACSVQSALTDSPSTFYLFAEGSRTIVGWRRIPPVGCCLVFVTRVLRPLFVLMHGGKRLHQTRNSLGEPRCATLWLDNFGSWF